MAISSFHSLTFSALPVTRFQRGRKCFFILSKSYTSKTINVLRQRPLNRLTGVVILLRQLRCITLASMLLGSVKAISSWAYVASGFERDFVRSARLEVSTGAEVETLPLSPLLKPSRCSVGGRWRVGDSTTPRTDLYCLGA